MAQYKIEATSVKKNATVSNVAKPFVVNPTDETEGIAAAPAPVIFYPSPAEFATKVEADANAVEFAKWLNQLDYQEAWDWVATATKV